MKEILQIITRCVILFILFACAGYVGLSMEHKQNVSKWNKGVCQECGGTYEFCNISRYHGTNYYCYVCDKCGIAISLSERMD